MSNTTLFQRGHVVTDGQVKVEDLLVVGDTIRAKGMNLPESDDPEIRALAQGALADTTAGALASPNPHTMQARELAAQAVGWMKTHSISQVVVMEGERYAGMVHLHDCLREGLG